MFRQALHFGSEPQLTIPSDNVPTATDDSAPVPSFAAAPTSWDEDQFRSFAEMLSDMVFTVTSEGRTDYVNRRWTESTGKDLKASQEADWDMIHSSDRPAFHQAWNQTLATGQVCEIECRVRMRSGDDQWYLCRFRPLQNNRGATVKWLGTLTNIHALKQALETQTLLYRASQKAACDLRESETLLRLLTDALPGLVAYVGPGLTYRYVNTAYSRWCDIPVEDLIGRNIFETTDADVVRVTRPQIELALRGQRVHFECVIQQGPRSSLAAISYIPDHGSDGSVRGVVAFIVDITERTRTAEALRESEERFHKTADTAPILLWMTDTSRQVVYMNKTWRRWTGREPNRDLGWGWTDSLHPEDAPTAMARFRSAFDRRERFQFEARLRVANNSFRWTAWEGVPRFGPGDVFEGYIGTATDVHEARIATEELARAKEAADAANSAKSRFVANMSHEVRTPLGVILGFTELLYNAPADDPQRTLYFEFIQRNGELLTRIVNEVLDLSKIEADRLEIEIERVPIVPLMRELQASLSLQARAHQAEFAIHSRGSIPAEIQSDPIRLKQILLNVVGNAIRFSERGTITVTIRRDRDAADPYSDELVFEVADERSGLTPEQAAGLFQPFHQVDPGQTHYHGGTGLGLTLGRRLARALGGDVRLTKTIPGQGNVFEIRLPIGTLETSWIHDLERALREQEPALVSAGPMLHDDQPLRGVRVLVADDSADNQALIGRCLSLAGADVVAVHNGSDAVDRALETSFDVIIMDIQMPRMNGYQATRLLRSEGLRTPILALTAHAMKDEREKCLAAGFDDHLTKPAKRDLLISRIAVFTAARVDLP